MAILVSVQIELVGEHPLLEVQSLISESILKAPTINDAVPSHIFKAVSDHAKRQLVLLTVSSYIPEDMLQPVMFTFSGELASEWQYKAFEKDYYLESGIPDDNGNTLWSITIEIVANCELEKEGDDDAPVKLTKIPSNVH